VRGRASAGVIESGLPRAPAADTQVKEAKSAKLAANKVPVGRKKNKFVMTGRQPFDWEHIYRNNYNWDSCCEKLFLNTLCFNRVI
jgi:hypothetical protein